MTREHDITVRELPSYAFGPRDPVWWGVVLLMAIEGTTLALSFLAYFYIRLRVDVWPTTSPGRAWRVGACEALVLLLSVPPTWRMTRAIRAGDLAGIQRWVAVVTALSFCAVVVRGFEFHALPFRWDTDAYASMVWGLLVLHATHLALGVIENAVFLALVLRGPVEKKHLVDLEVNGIYWYFVVAGGVAIAAVVYGEALLS